MTTRRVPLLLVALSLLVVPMLRAQDAAPDIENAKFRATGEINANAVYIRSGASENDYPTMKLDRGQKITVTGVKFDWLKIAPPDGSYCYVAKAYVEKRGDGTVGRVTNTLNVRVGSSLNAMKTKVATKLEVGDDVKILGEQDEYFKIAPPKDVYFYVNKQFVDLVGVAKEGAPKTEVIAEKSIEKPTVPPTPGEQQIQTPPTGPTEVANGGQTGTGKIATEPAGTGGGSGVEAPQTPERIAEAPATQPNESTGIAISPTTKPADAQALAEAQFDTLERTFLENDKKSVDQQPLTELQSGYEKLAAGGALPESLRRMVDYRLSIIKQRGEDQQKYIALKKSQEEVRQRQTALQAERQELEERIAKSGIKYFTAVGTLRVSSLQQGGGTLYRLTDPGNGRTVVYVRTDDPKLGALVGSFVGVKGTVTDEQALNLKSITPTEFEAVDQTKVNISVAAQIVPPSLRPTGTASTGGN